MLNKSIFAIICCSFLGCSLPLTVDDDIAAVSGGIVSPATHTQRAMSRFESSRLKEPVLSQAVPKDSSDNDDVAGSRQGAGDAQNVMPPNFSPLIP